MSTSLDVNVLLYASDSTSPMHAPARALLARLASSNEIVGLAWIVAMSYLRIATHSRIFERPLTPTVAKNNLESLMTLDNVRMIGENERFWDCYRKCATDIPIKGNLVPDAHLACLLQANGIHVLYTNDSDFRRFTFLDVRPIHKR